jgi:hypothetical protein
MTTRLMRFPSVLILSVLLAAFGFPACSDDPGGNGQPDSGTEEDGGQVGADDGNTGADDGSTGGDDGGGYADPGYDAGSDPGYDAGYDAGSDPGDQGSGADICDEVHVAAEPIKPNVLLCVDKSGSMNDPITAGSANTKIQDTKTALNVLLDFGREKIRFGWMQFPLDDECQPGVIEEDCADDSVDRIRTLVLQLQPIGGTPTGESLEAALGYQGLHDETRDNFIILLTDGVPTCPHGNGRIPNQEDNDLALDALRDLHAENIDTFVIGLGEDVNNFNPALLNEMAIAGGRPRPGGDKYYPANSLDELQQAFQDIIESVISCELQLDIPPDIPEWLWVYLDGVLADRDETHQNGWDYDEALNQVIFYGPMCDLLRTGQVQQVEVVVGCGPPV